MQAPGARRQQTELHGCSSLWGNALTGIAYDDDSQIAELRAVKGYDKARPRIEIEVGEL